MSDTITTTTDLGGTVSERAMADGGRLRFEQFEVGQWLTKAGQPAKVARRRYELDGQPMDSVSSIVDNIDKPGLVRWAEDHGARGGATAQFNGLLENVADDQIIHVVRSNQLGAEAVRDEAADRGHAIHFVFENLARHGHLPEEPVREEWQPWVQGASSAWLDLRPKALQVEHMVCHRALGYAGRLDLIADVDGARTLVDYKTGKGKIYDQAHYQTRLYEMAARACGDESIEQIIIVGVSETGGWESVTCEATEADALSLLALHRGRKRINAGMAKQRAAAKAGRKAVAA